MFRKILLPVDGSELSDKSIEHALNYAQAARADIVVVPISQKTRHAPALPDETPERAVPAGKSFSSAMDIAESVTEAARKIGVYCDTARPELSSPIDAILETYRRYCCDVIYINSQDPAESRKSGGFVSSLVYQILEKAAVPVLVFR